jgi:hypothetical protein
MGMSFGGRIKHAWSAFTTLNEPQQQNSSFEYGGASYGGRPDRVRLSFSNERSIVTSVYTRLGIDVAAVDIRHVRLDENGRYLSDVDSGLNTCLTLEANIDQAARALRQDAAMTLFDRGTIAIVPVDTTINPADSGGYDVKSLRVGEILVWYPKKVTIRLYNDNKGIKEDITLLKSNVAIIENPFYSVMNESNSTLQRLIRKLGMLDLIDEQSSSGKLDLIIQLPFVIKSEARRLQAETRRKDIEVQLKGSQYGIAYTDGTEKITQLNRPAENNLLAQIESLTAQLYSQLGLTKEVFDGTADEATMLNYYTRTIEPVIAAITDGMKRAFLTKTARAQLQSIMYFRDPFKLVAVKDLAEIADKFTRNEILSPNDVRPLIGFRPVKDAKADELRNRNMPEPSSPAPVPSPPPALPAPAPQLRITSVKEGDLQNGSRL